MHGLFDKFGKIAELKVMRDRDGRSRFSTVFVGNSKGFWICHI